MKLLTLLVAIVAVLAMQGSSYATELPAATPQTVGPRPDKLAEITQWLRGDVEKEALPGAVLLIVRHGKVAYFEAVGSQHPARQTPMSRDAIRSSNDLPYRTRLRQMVYEALIQ